MNQFLMFFLAAVFIIGVLLLVVIMLTRKGPHPLDVEKYRSRWLAIEQGLRQAETSSYQLSVLNADKLLDQAMKDRGCGGNTTAERMKVATPKWSQSQQVWAAHKLRNKIAHEPDFTVTYNEARQAMGAFKRALKELGAI